MPAMAVIAVAGDITASMGGAAAWRPVDDVRSGERGNCRWDDMERGFRASAGAAMGASL